MTRAAFEDEAVDGTTQVVAVSGELDLTNIGDLRRHLEGAFAAGRSRIVVDLDAVTHMDSSGLAELITTHQRAQSVEGGVVLVVSSPPLRRTLEIRGVRDLFTIVPTREEALATFAG